MSAVLPRETVAAELSDAPPLSSIVTADEVARRYGAGDTAVDALRGV